MVPPLENLLPIEATKAAAVLLGAASAGLAASDEGGAPLSTDGFAVASPCRTLEWCIQQLSPRRLGRKVCASIVLKSDMDRHVMHHMQAQYRVLPVSTTSWATHEEQS